MLGFRLIKGLGREVLFFSYRFGVCYIRCRGHLPILLNVRGLVGEGAEVGVKQGEFSERILASWRGRILHSIDPWKKFPDDEYRDKANVEQAIQDQYYRETAARLGKFGARSRLWRQTSQAAATQFRDGQLDFVYIDAQHHYAAVKEDIRLWYPKIRTGGLLCGHDYEERIIGGTLFGVKSAVNEFVRSQGLRLLVSHDEFAPSWFVFV